MSFGTVMANPFIWIWTTFGLIGILILFIIFLWLLSKKTHAMVEFKAWTSGKPIAMFFQENRYVEWKPVKPDAGIIVDKNYGAFIINERATYVDKRTKNVIIPFDSQFGASINVRAAKLVDDLQYITKDEEEMKKLRHVVANNLIDDNETIDVLKTSINFGCLKTMMTALIPHNINAKIEKTVASRMKGYGKVDPMTFLIYFGGVLGAIIIGYLMLRMVGR